MDHRIPAAINQTVTTKASQDVVVCTSEFICQANSPRPDHVATCSSLFLFFFPFLLFLVFNLCITSENASLFRIVRHWRNYSPLQNCFYLIWPFSLRVGFAITMIDYVRYYFSSRNFTRQIFREGTKHSEIFHRRLFYRVTRGLKKNGGKIEKSGIN